MGHKGKRKLGKCICDHCGIEFEKPLSEIKRNEKLKRRNFCSRKCTGYQAIVNLKNVKNNYDISQHSSNRKDGFSLFRYHLRNIRNRDKEFDVDLEYLKELWGKQNGICPFTGVKLILNGYTKIHKDPRFAASLDRIDSDKGYVKGNVRWVSRSINLMKQQMTDENVFEFLKIISERYKGEDLLPH